MPKLEIEKCVITQVYKSEKTGKFYITIQDGVNTFNIGSGDLDLSAVPTLTPVKISAEIGGFVYGRNQVLEFKDFKSIPVNGRE